MPACCSGDCARDGRGPSCRYPERMAKQSKKPADLNRLAAAIVGEATDETRPQEESRHARAGRIGGEKGGDARARKLPPERRREIAKKAAARRWAPE
jgi:hypothetical protein